MKTYAVILLSLIFVSACSSQSDRVKRIKELSEEIKFIDLHEFKYNRVNRYKVRNPNKAMIDFVEVSKSLNDNEINELLTSANSKLRALGILCLYQSDSHENIMKIVNFLDDTISCYKPNPYPKYTRALNIREEQPRLEERLEKVQYSKVSHVASSIISFYFKQSGHVYFDKELDQFLNEREDLSYTAGFLKLLKLKATGGTSPFQEERINYVNALKVKIEEVSNETDKSIYKLYLSADGYQLYSNAELIKELKSLGKENLKLILERTPPTKDPDLLNVKNSELSNWQYNRMCKWILLNAEAIFDEQDASYFVQQEKSDREKTLTWRTTLYFPYWHIAAARLDRKNAKSYIVNCLGIFNGKHNGAERGELYAELIHLTGEQDFKFVSDWILDDYALNEYSNENIDHFIHNLNRKEDLKFLKYLIQNPRFESHMKVWDVIQVAWQINKLKGEEIIADYLTREIRHPFGLFRVEWWREKALKKYPDATMEMIDKTKRLIKELKTVSKMM